MKKLILLATLAGVSLGLTACGGGGSGGGGGTVVVTPPPADPNAKYGAKFAADFKAGANTTPASVSASDVVAPDPAATPSSVH